MGEEEEVEEEEEGEEEEGDQGIGGDGRHKDHKSEGSNIRSLMSHSFLGYRSHYDVVVCYMLCLAESILNLLLSLPLFLIKTPKRSLRAACLSVIFGYLAIWLCAKTMPERGIPEKSIKNVAQRH